MAANSPDKEDVLGDNEEGDEPAKRLFSVLNGEVSKQRNYSAAQPEEHNKQKNSSVSDADDTANQPNSPREDFNRSHNWQDTRGSVKERLAYMYHSKYLADVKFIFSASAQETITVPAHKFVLSMSSAVFDAMFNGPLATKDTDIHLLDVEPGAFEVMLCFIYTDKHNYDSDSVMATLYVSKKYAIIALEEACIKFLQGSICSSNAFTLLSQARLFDEPLLAKMCLEAIEKNTYEAISAEGFEEIDRDTLICVLEKDYLSVRERRLFTAVLKWAEAECARQNLEVTGTNKRKVLDGILDLIRFPLMTVEEFAVLQYGEEEERILSDSELVNLFFYFTVSPKPETKFITRPRCCKTSQEQTVTRFCQIEHRWGYSGASDKVKITVNRRIFVVGFGLYGSVHGSAEHRVNMQIVDNDRQVVIGETTTSYRSDGTPSTFHVRFKDRVEISAGVHYVCSVTIKGPDSYYGTKGLRKVVHDSMSGPDGKVTFNFSYATGNNNGTCVEDGQIPEILFYI